MKIAEVKTADLAKARADYNPRRISDDDMTSLRRSIRFFGVVEPIVFNRRTRRVVGGHQRIEAALLENKPTLPTLEIDIDEPTEKQLNLALNRIGGTWDETALGRVLAELNAAGVDMANTGFRPGEIEKFIAATRASDEAADQAPDLPVKATAKPGDIWELDEHRILCADSSDQKAVERVLERARPALLITDPPYGVDYTGKTKEKLKIGNDALTPEQTQALASRAFAAAGARLAAGGIAYIASPAGPMHTRFVTAFRMAGLEYHQTLIWKKDSMVLGRSDYHYQHECVIYGWKPGKRYFTDDGSRTTIIEVPRPKASRQHPTMKPIALWEELMANSTTPGQAVIDTFLGSGTTIIACERLGRRGFGIEIDPRYVDVAVGRWEETTGHKAARRKR